MILIKTINYKKFKAYSDLVFATILIIILIPLFIFISLSILFNLGWPILFTQKRPGYKSKVFKIYKFRTMKNIKDKKGNLLPNNQRFTNLGNWLRQTSLDELPELINVIRGEMSFIGPRPLLVEYLNLYNKKQLTRHEVKPGITGWAQVNGRNSISWEEKFEYDLEYVNKVSLKLDLKIIFKTIWLVYKKSNINFSVSSTMPKFTGNKKKKNTKNSS